jgi:hypothetical protein
MAFAVDETPHSKIWLVCTMPPPLQMQFPNPAAAPNGIVNFSLSAYCLDLTIFLLLALQRHGLNQRVTRRYLLYANVYI